MRAPALVLLLLIMPAGCIAPPDDAEGFTIVIEPVRPVAQSIYDEGELVESRGASIRLTFDAEGDADIDHYRIHPGETLTMIEANGSDSNVMLTYDRHGTYSITVEAVMTDGVRMLANHNISIDHLVRWTESGTGTPRTLTFDTTPSPGSSPPAHVIINSTVRNPSSLLEVDGREVTVEWTLANEEGVCQMTRSDVPDGESVTWPTIHFIPIGIHELNIDLIEGQDRIDIDHEVLISYRGA